MIKFNLHKPLEISDEGFCGILGENLITKQKFIIDGLTDPTMTFTIHLRFADGTVNSVIPDSTTVSEEGTEVVWNIRKNDIFMHGYFEVQIEGRNAKGEIFQTEIATLYADESIPIEDKEYINPNSETLKLRDEINELCNELIKQNEQLAENIDIIQASNLSNKQDKLTFDSSPVLGSDNPVTSDGIAKALNLKADIENVYLVEEADDHFISKHEASLAYATIADLNKKYDASNMESGSGTLVPVANTYANAASFTYTKTGNMITVTISATVNNTNSGVAFARFAGLPYPVKSGSTQNNLIVSQLANHYRSTVINSTLYLTPVSSSTLTPIVPTNGDVINVCLVYEI